LTWRRELRELLKWLQRRSSRWDAAKRTAVFIPIRAD
jgi:hypothetical protein